MTAASLFARHERIATQVATGYRIPGLDPDDIRQEARVALWEACRTHDPARGRFPTFARTVINRHLTDLLRAATTLKRTAELDRDTDPPAPDHTEGREQLSLLVDRLPALTGREREAVRNHLNGSPARSSKAHETALYRARRKLRDAHPTPAEDGDSNRQEMETYVS